MKKTIVVLTLLGSVFFFSMTSLAMTPDQVIALKKAGVSEKTIQMMIKQEEAAAAAKEAGKDPYATMGTREVKDKDGNTVIIYTTGYGTNSAADDEEKQKVEKAWDMLRNMTIKTKQ